MVEVFFDLGKISLSKLFLFSFVSKLDYVNSSETLENIIIIILAPFPGCNRAAYLFWHDCKTHIYTYEEARMLRFLIKQY